jgi:hypothetical protein
VSASFREHHTGISIVSGSVGGRFAENNGGAQAGMLCQKEKLCYDCINALRSMSNSTSIDTTNRKYKRTLRIGSGCAHLASFRRSSSGCGRLRTPSFRAACAKPKLRVSTGQDYQIAKHPCGACKTGQCTLRADAGLSCAYASVLIF